MVGRGWVLCSDGSGLKARTRWNSTWVMDALEAVPTHDKKEVLCKCGLDQKGGVKLLLMTESYVRCWYAGRMDLTMEKYM